MSYIWYKYRPENKYYISENCFSPFIEAGPASNNYVDVNPLLRFDELFSLWIAEKQDIIGTAMTAGDYEKFDKKDNQYFISLKDLSKKYKYNFDNFINKETHKECDKETSGIYFDTDNVRKLEYFKNPIVIDLKCE